MQVLYLTLFTILLKVVSCSHDFGLSEYLQGFFSQPNRDNIKEHIKMIVEKKSAEFALHTADTTKISSALISLAEEGSISTVEKFLELYSKRQSSIPTPLISLVIVGTSIKVTAKLLQTGLIKCLHVRYDVIQRNDVKDLLHYLHTKTDVLDGDRLSVWLREISLSKLPSNRDRFDDLAARANYEALKAACDQLGNDCNLVASRPLLSAMTRINKRISLLLTLFTKESNTLPSVIVEIINTYITADE